MVPENDSSVIEKPLLRLKAIDRDLDENARLSFRVAGFWKIRNQSGSPLRNSSIERLTVSTVRGNLDCVSGLFCLDKSDGTLSAGSIVLDHEEASAYVMTVEVSDNGQPSLSGAATVEIKVLDKNDERPTFAQKVFQLSVMENTATRNCSLNLGTLQASDRDGVNFNKFSMYLQNPLPPSEIAPSTPSTLRSANEAPTKVMAIDMEKLFKATGKKSETQKLVSVSDDNSTSGLIRVDPRTGSVSACRPFDREERDTYEFVVVVSDLDRPDFQDTAKVKWGIFNFFLMKFLD